MREFKVIDSFKKTSFSQRIEEGKKIQRENLQRIKNESIKKEIERGSGIDSTPDFPIYKGISNEYSFFGSFFLSDDDLDEFLISLYKDACSIYENWLNILSFSSWLFFLFI